MTMTTKQAKPYEITQAMKAKCESFMKLSQQIKDLINQKALLEETIIKELLKDKKIHTNQYFNVGELFVGVAQSKATESTDKKQLEAKLIELGIDLKPFIVKVTKPKKVLKVELTGK